MRVVTVELSTSAGWRGGADTAAPARPAGTCLHGGWWGCPGCRHGAERPPTRAEPDEVPADEHGHVERAVGRGIQCDVMGPSVSCRRVSHSRLRREARTAWEGGRSLPAPPPLPPQPGEPCHPASSCRESSGQTSNTRAPGRPCPSPVLVPGLCSPATLGAWRLPRLPEGWDARALPSACKPQLCCRGAVDPGPR